MPNAPRSDEGPIRIAANTISAAQASRGPAAPPLGDIRVDIGKEALHQIVQDRRIALTRVYQTLQGITNDLKNFFPQVPQVLPTRIQGQLLGPDGSPAQQVSVLAEPPQYATDEAGGAVVWPSPRTLTDARGAFALTLPTVPIPRLGMRLKIQGANSQTELALRRVDLLSDKLGVLTLDIPLKPLPASVVARLKAIVPTSAGDVEDNPEDFADPAPVVTLAEGDCARSFQSNSGVIDKFGYSVLIRLVEPQVSPKQLVVHARQGGEAGFTSIPMSAMTHAALGNLDSNTALGYLKGLGGLFFADRVPIDQPIDVTGFHNSIEHFPKWVPKAATLGLGYIVKMHQIWIPTGMSLGDMLYALPLAPGEQQRIAVHEQSEALSVRDVESMSAQEQQQFRETSDSTALGTFNSAYREQASGGSSMETEASSGSFGGGLGLGAMLGPVLLGVGLGGGYGSSSSSGSTSSWQQGSRDYVSSAVQDFHAALGRSAAASRRSWRTGVRLATASDAEQITTKVITNHNHCHALTIQYWQVLRHYGVSSHVDDVQLVSFVPLEIIQFAQSGEPNTLEGAETHTYTRDELLTRYAMLIRYHDVLMSRLRWVPEHRYALQLLMHFASDPTAKVQSAGGLNQDQVTVKVSGTFLPNDELYVTMVTRSGQRVGPVKLIGASAPIAQETYVNQDDLLQALRTRRAADSGETRTAELALPSYVARSDIARFEISRRFDALSLRLKPAPPQWVPDGPPIFGAPFGHWQNQAPSTVNISGADLEQQLGGPWIWDVKAAVTGTSDALADLYAGRAAAVQMGTLLPVPAIRLAPVLSYSDLLRIEALYQHVVQNTVTYSKAVWMALTPEERAILLERFTIGVPAGGVSDPTQEVPLLNCVANQVIGYFGNCAVMPFQIPPQVAEAMKITSRDVQEALLKFHRQAFVPPRSSITLPTHGMLGEAVLGTCTSCEKIDITRFWNWQDSPADSATDLIKASDLFKGQSLIGPNGAQAPSQLTATGNTSMITIAPTSTQQPPANLLDTLTKGPQGAIPNMTGLDDLQKQMQQTLQTASDARQQAMQTGKEMATKVLDQLPSVMKAAADVKETTDQKSASSQKDNLDKLTGNADKYIAVTGAQSDQAGADAFAKTIVKQLFADKLPGMADLAPLYDKFKVGASDDAATKKGKLAWLKALGLPLPAGS